MSVTALIQPLPWTPRANGADSMVVDDNGFAVCGGLTEDEAEFIARACNAHEALHSALGAAWQDIHEWVRHAREVRSKVERPNYSIVTATEAGIERSEQILKQISAAFAKAEAAR